MRINDWSSDVCSSDLQMRAAVETIAHIPVRSEADVAEHGRLLGLFASDYGFAPAAYAGMALHARAIAMDRWCNLHDPFGETDVDAFYEAGARAKLMRTEDGLGFDPEAFARSEEHTSELQSLMRISYAVFCLKKKKTQAT